MCKSCCVVMVEKDQQKNNEIKNQRVLRGKILKVLGDKFCVKFVNKLGELKTIPKSKRVEKIIIDMRISENDILYIESHFPLISIYQSLDDFKEKKEIKTT